MTVINFPKRVVAVGVDTSSERYAIAVLFEERMGIVCNIEQSTVSF